MFTFPHSAREIPLWVLAIGLVYGALDELSSRWSDATRAARLGRRRVRRVVGGASSSGSYICTFIPRRVRPKHHLPSPRTPCSWRRLKMYEVRGRLRWVMLLVPVHANLFASGTGRRVYGRGMHYIGIDVHCLVLRRRLFRRPGAAGRADASGSPRRSRRWWTRSSRSGAAAAGDRGRPAGGLVVPAPVGRMWTRWSRATRTATRCRRGRGQERRDRLAKAAELYRGGYVRRCTRVGRWSCSPAQAACAALSRPRAAPGERGAKDRLAGPAARRVRRAEGADGRDRGTEDESKDGLREGTDQRLPDDANIGEDLNCC